MQYAKFSEFFMTHPTLSRRVHVIARIGQIPPQQLGSVLADEDVPEDAR